MNKIDIQYCPSTLAKDFNTYSTTALRNMFNGKKVNHILQYEAPNNSDEVDEQFFENRKRISISGVQEKLSLILEKNILRLTKEGEQGTYILKPIPRDLKKVNQVPANENLTMQIAKQVFGIATAENALIFFKNGEPAYITKRFDLDKNGNKLAIEDFATLAEKTNKNAGVNFKYEYSYEEMAMLIKKYVPAWRVEIEKFFTLILFNYLFSNGDAHLKNFSLIESSTGDLLLSPAYDLINTKLHVDDVAFALNKGLFADGRKSILHNKTGYPSKSDFILFANVIGIMPLRIEKLLHPFLQKQAAVEMLTKNSFLNDASKKAYLIMYNTRLNYLKGK
jgi:serine/threonine-protein kinase HipA